ncbi:MAG: JAB domain-containing protein [Reinekea sp.]|jgi:DNA repair protein RadC
MTEAKHTPSLRLQDGQWVITLPVDENTIIEYAQQILQKRFERLSEPLNSFGQIQDFLMATFQRFEREVYAGLFLDSAHRVIAMEYLFYGALTSTAVAPREIIQVAMKHNAAAFILIHNNPAGVATASKDAIDVSAELQAICSMFELNLLDHYVIGEDEIISFKEQGHL